MMEPSKKAPTEPQSLDCTEPVLATPCTCSIPILEDLLRIVIYKGDSFLFE